MKNRFTTTIASILFGLALILIPATSFAVTPQEAACQGIGGNYNSGTGECSTGAGGSPSVPQLISDVVNVFSIVIGIVAVIMILVTGFKYITSNGDAGKITSAKNTLIYAVVGLVIVALAQVIVHFVVNTASSVPK